jgi:hypothetical protein
VSTSVAVLDVLSGREKAALLWMLGLIGYATVEGGRSVTSSFGDVVRALFQAKLLLVFGSAALYCVAWYSSRGGRGCGTRPRRKKRCTGSAE